MLSQQDIARDHETGYLVVPDVLDADLLGRARAASCSMNFPPGTPFL